MKSTKLKKYGKIGFTILIIILLGVYLFRNKEDLKVFLTISWVYIALISFGIILTQLTNSAFLKEIMKVFNKDISWGDSTEITFLSSMTNSLTPFRGGAGVRAVYLKDKFKLQYKSFVTVLLGNYVIIFLVYSFLGLLALLPFIGDENVRTFQLYTTMGFFIFIFIGMILLILFDMNKLLQYLPERWKSLRSFKRLLININTGWQKIVARKDVLLWLVLISLVNYLIVMAVFYLELRSIGLFVEIQNLMVYTTMTSLSLLLSFTPGSLGIKEAVLLFGQDLLGLEGSQIIAISIFDRTLSVIVIMLSFFSIVGIKKLREIYKKTKI